MENNSVNPIKRPNLLFGRLRGVRVIYLVILVLNAATFALFHVIMAWLYYFVYSVLALIVFAWLSISSLELYRIIDRNESLFMDLPLDAILLEIYKQWPDDDRGFFRLYLSLKTLLLQFIDISKRFINKLDTTNDKA